MQPLASSGMPVLTHAFFTGTRAEVGPVTDDDLSIDPLVLWDPGNHIDLRPKDIFVVSPQSIRLGTFRKAIPSKAEL